MTTATFDTYSFIQQLTKAGMTTEQAEIQSTAFNTVLVELQNETLNEVVKKKDIAHLATETSVNNLRVELVNTKAEIIKWVAGMLIAQVAVGVTLFKLLS